MDGYESTRRDFLRKIGLTVTATVAGTTGNIAAKVVERKTDFTLTPEQQSFMDSYEAWMDEFIPVIRRQKLDADDSENNKKLVELSFRVKQQQEVLLQFMKDPNFARYYMVATERMTHEI